jgi:hypothetical protein
LPPGHIDGGKDIFHPGLLGIKANGKKVLLCVIGDFQDTPERGDGGAHGVGAAASDKPALLDHACNPEIYALAIHGESSVKPIRPGLRLYPARLAVSWGKLIYFTKFCLCAHHCRLVPPRFPRRRPVRVPAILAK